MYDSSVFYDCVNGLTECTDRLMNRTGSAGTHWIIGLIVGFFVLGLIGAAGQKVSEWFK